jgi:hypothetical protein
MIDQSDLPCGSQSLCIAGRVVGDGRDRADGDRTHDDESPEPGKYPHGPGSLTGDRQRPGAISG